MRAWVGAWTPCRHCQFVPGAGEEQARSLLLSDHFLDRAGLARAAETLKGGGALDFPADQVDSVVEMIGDAASQEEFFAEWSARGRSTLKKLLYGAILVVGGLLLLWYACAEPFYYPVTSARLELP